MPKERARANGAATPDISAVRLYADALQTEAMHLGNVLSAIEFLENEGTCAEERSSLTSIANRMARTICEGLDSVNFPEGET
ncbi:hypothetical protein LVO79_21070 (plasmid) [Roseivivax marinus]|uniref:hypothetical protein n=1 Tax=Roseivivax marinus TaxID=1379903 RepID=UPI001F034483|nr:hypothetical protein [Roseivivax marinus]UMA67292.1 hypothetical protein LVO79_21070 [Roseivivax marinus]